MSLSQLAEFDQLRTSIMSECLCVYAAISPRSPASLLKLTEVMWCDVWCTILPIITCSLCSTLALSQRTLLQAFPPHSLPTVIRRSLLRTHEKLSGKAKVKLRLQWLLLRILLGELAVDVCNNSNNCIGKWTKFCTDIVNIILHKCINFLKVTLNTASAR